MEELLSQLILNGVESEYLDFKAEQYSDKVSLLKDFIAMANSHYSGDKYIIIGVKDTPGLSREVVGIPPTEIKDCAEYQQFIFENVDPYINFNFLIIDFNQVKLGVFQFYNNTKQPYMMKKDYRNLHSGHCFIRKGSINTLAVRSDFDLFYSNREEFKITFLDPLLSSINDRDGNASIKLSLRNLTSLPILIDYGKLFIKDSTGSVLTEHQVYGFDHYEGVDFQIELARFSEKTGFLIVDLGSTNCVTLGLNENGYTNETFNFELLLEDTLGNKYRAELNDGQVWARGNVLHKVHLKRRIRN
ncbi:ATP-binding protein [Cohnella sp. GCM10012308]|uniref:ATP-binding protein n=1 Tax=Cohnella sp. GCM10012308 TaxID=3317329 RepID=UPI003620A61C